MNVLILNVFNVYQEQSEWSGRLSEERPRQTRGATAFEDVIELTPKDGVWQTPCEEMISLEPRNPRVAPYERLTYNSSGGFTSSPTSGSRVNLVV